MVEKKQPDEYSLELSSEINSLNINLCIIGKYAAE